MLELGTPFVRSLCNREQTAEGGSRFLRRSQCDLLVVVH